MTSKRYVTVNVVLVTLLVLVGYLFKIDNKEVEFETGQNFTVRVQNLGYSAEEHRIVTQDGFILKMFRMRQKKCLDKIVKVPVILQHGLVMSADVWLDSGPDTALAYRLADACFDLWFGNSRGNYYSREHTTLDPDADPEYWQWSVDEMGKYDVPAAVDYVLKFTDSKKLNYIGYSQGSGSFFIMCSERPGYCEKVGVHIGLAPAARQTLTGSRTYRFLTKVFDVFHKILSSLNMNEILNRGGFGQTFLEHFCAINSFSKKLCIGGVAVLDSYHESSISYETQQFMYKHFPAGTSVQNMARYGQSMNVDKFVKFDFGSRKNLLVYGEENPPSHNLSAVTSPVYLIHGRRDQLVDIKDVEWLQRKLPNVLGMHVLEDPHWNHMDMVFSKFVGQSLYPIVEKCLRQFS